MADYIIGPKRVVRETRIDARGFVTVGFLLSHEPRGSLEETVKASKVDATLLAERLKQRGRIINYQVDEQRQLIIGIGEGNRPEYYIMYNQSEIRGDKEYPLIRVLARRHRQYCPPFQP